MEDQDSQAWFYSLTEAQQEMLEVTREELLQAQSQIEAGLLDPEYIFVVMDRLTYGNVDEHWRDMCEMWMQDNTG